LFLQKDFVFGIYTVLLARITFSKGHGLESLRLSSHNYNCGKYLLCPQVFSKVESSLGADKRDAFSLAESSI